MTELMVILVIALLVLGPTKLPQVARSIGKGMRELRRASDDLRSAVMWDDEQPDYRRRQPPPAREIGPAAGLYPENGADEVAKVENQNDESSEVESVVGGSALTGTVARGEVIEDAEVKAIVDEGQAILAANEESSDTEKKSEEPVT